MSQSHVARRMCVNVGLEFTAQKQFGKSLSFDESIIWNHFSNNLCIAYRSASTRKHLKPYKFSKNIFTLPFSSPVTSLNCCLHGCDLSGMKYDYIVDCGNDFSTSKLAYCGDQAVYTFD